AATPSSAPAATVQSHRAPSQRITKYTLPADRYQKARNLAKIHFRFALISLVYGLVVLWLILRWRLSANYRSFAESKSSKRFLQALVFSPLVILTIDVLQLPTGIYQNWVSRQYGLSVQGWGSWFWDWTKGELISVILGILLIWLLYAVIRKSPRRWWFYFWLASLPIGLLVFFLQPLIIDPLFNKFEPLQQKDPVLTASLEKMVQRAGQNIPPERMFWMNASEKTTAVDAYVTGFGASKRIVVLDTTIAKATTPEIVFVAGHEMGHYVLEHIPKSIVFFAALLLVFFYLAFRSIGWVLARWGAKWDVRGVDDWASLPALLLLISIFFFIANPIGSAFSRYHEHQADQYGLEVTHGLTPDSGQVAAQGFNLLGDVDLGDPEPNPVDVFLFYSHPPIPDRVQFALTYDPWSKGGNGEFVK
ncbi:MAG TPA: M48 family metallopeptidase, partial [Candidatus Dormibacteraeota bacterium]|nr:M48 family metallopeptidase [Candidatus Dormibacteraeota bacterium]